MCLKSRKIFQRCIIFKLTYLIFTHRHTEGQLSVPSSFIPSHVRVQKGQEAPVTEAINLNSGRTCWREHNLPQCVGKHTHIHTRMDILMFLNFQLTKMINQADCSSCFLVFFALLKLILWTWTLSAFSDNVESVVKWWLKGERFYLNVFTRIKSRIMSSPSFIIALCKHSHTLGSPCNRRKGYKYFRDNLSLLPPKTYEKGSVFPNLHITVTHVMARKKQYPDCCLPFLWPQRGAF